jgi:hypothetical protein
MKKTLIKKVMKMMKIKKKTKMNKKKIKVKKILWRNNSKNNKTILMTYRIIQKLRNKETNKIIKEESK